MSEVVNIPQLRFPEFNGEWEEKALGVVATITTGSTPSTSNNEYYDGDVAFVSPADIQGNRIVRSTKTTITELGLSVVREIKKRSTLFVCIGSTIGKVSQAGVNCATNQQINALTAKNSFDNDFIYSLLEFKAPRIKLLAGVQAVPQINKSEFSRFKFTFPLLPEQQKIASFLAAVDEKIEQLIKKQELLGSWKKGLMQQIFSQAIRFKADDGGDYPDWEELKLGEVARFRRGSFPQPYGNPEWYDDEDGKPFVQVYDVAGNMRLKSTTKRKISVLAQSSSVFVPKGNVVLTIQGSIGRIALTQYDAYVDRTLLIFTGYIKEVNKQFFIYVIYLLFEIEKIKAPGGTIKTITKEALTSFKLDLPCFDEQTKIANFLSSIDNKIEQVGKQLDESKQFKKALLQQMFV